MRVLRRKSTCHLTIALVALAGSAARADELLVMPYACSVVGGQVMLTPSRDEGHRVIGQREQRNFSACSPANPDMCRHWTVHRFDLDCGGARVPWTSVVAAAGGRRNQRAWIEDGRLRLRMGPAWTMAPGDPCARGYGYDDRWRSGRMARYCADRRDLAGSSTVDMPFGFAPMFGIDAIFVPASGPGAAGSRPPPFGAQPPPIGPPVAAVPPPPPMAAVPPPPKVARAEPPASPSPPRPEPAQRDAAAKDVLAKAAPAPQVESQAQSPPPPVPAATPGAPIVPKIINRPDAAAAGTPAPAAPVTVVPKTSAAPAEPAQKVAVIPPSPIKEAGRQDTPAAVTTGAVGTRPESAGMFSAMRGSTGAVLLGFAGLTLLLLTAFALARRRERTRLAGVPSRDIASVDLGGGGRRRLAVIPGGGRGSAGGPMASGQPPSPPARFDRLDPPPTLGDSIPQTRAEALQVLGIGVTPDASQAAIKKVVDGLRQSWHPDYATSPADRQLRELRLKQINAAWEIMAATRAEA